MDSDGRHAAWPNTLAGDRGYRAEWIDKLLSGLGITPVIPSKTNEGRDAPALTLTAKAICVET